MSTGLGRARLLLLAAAATLLFLPGRSSGAGFETPIAPLRTQHATVRLLLAAGGAAPGGQVEAGLHFELEPGWHIYWQNAGDSGEPPAIAWTLPAGVSASGLEFPAPRRLPYGPLLDYGYEGEVTLPLRLRVEAGARPAAGQAVARVRWLVCREVCLPGKGEFSFPWRVLPAGAEAPRYDAGYLRQAFAALPAPLPAGSRAVFAFSPGRLRLAVLTGRPEAGAQFFPAQAMVIDNPAPQQAEPLPRGVLLTLAADKNLAAPPARLAGLVVFPDGRAFRVEASPGPVPASRALPGPGAYGAEAGPGAPAGTRTGVPAGPQAAPGAGSPAGPDRGPGPASPGGAGALLRAAALALAGGMLLNLMPCVFPVLFLKGLSLLESSQQERSRLRAHGLVYALGILVSFWAVVGLLLLLRAGGRQLGWGFQFQSPGFVALMAMLFFFLGLSLAGQFELGLGLSSAGGGLAQKRGYAGSFFTGVLAMVVATPCTAPWMGAAVGYALAQPAASTLAVFTALALGLALPYVTLTLEPAWVRALPRPGVWMELLKQATAIPIFATVIWLLWIVAQLAGGNALAGVLVSLLLLAIAGWVLGRYPLRAGATAAAAAIVLAAAGVALGSVRLLASPPAGYQTGHGIAAAGTGSESPRWEPWSEERLARYRAQGRPVLVDFTAAWCLSCQVNERLVLDRADVGRSLREKNVALLRADWTAHDERIGRALAALGRSGIPAYALYLPGEAQPRLLPEVLTAGLLRQALAAAPTVFSLAGTGSR